MKVGCLDDSIANFIRYLQIQNQAQAIFWLAQILRLANTPNRAQAC